jgi:hypothetical protein
VLYNLSQGPHHLARVFNRCFINGFLFRMLSTETNLSTQNSVVVVKGDVSTGNMDWYGVVQRVIALDFPIGKEVVLFQCDWYDVPSDPNKKGRGYRKDRYGIIDIDTTCFRYSAEPYILEIQAEQVFFVNDVKKPGWCSVVRMLPRNLFSMPEEAGAEKEGEIDVDSLVVGMEDMSVIHNASEVSNWTRADMPGVSVAASVIEKAIAQSMAEPNDAD